MVARKIEAGVDHGPGRLHRASEAAPAAQRLVPRLHSIEGNLRFLHPQAAGQGLVQQEAIGQQHRTEPVAGQPLVQFLERRIEERLAAGKQRPQTLHGVQFIQNRIKPARLQVGRFGRAQVAMPAGEVAPTRELDLQIAERRTGRLAATQPPGLRRAGEDKQVLAPAKGQQLAVANLFDPAGAVHSSRKASPSGSSW